MKVDIESVDIKREWKPQRILITIESVEEARLLFHVFNRNHLLSAFKDGGYYNFNSYASEIQNNFDTGKNNIEAMIKNQGFDL